MSRSAPKSSQGWLELNAFNSNQPVYCNLKCTVILFSYLRITNPKTFTVYRLRTVYESEYPFKIKV